MPKKWVCRVCGETDTTKFYHHHPKAFIGEDKPYICMPCDARQSEQRVFFRAQTPPDGVSHEAFAWSMDEERR